MTALGPKWAKVGTKVRRQCSTPCQSATRPLPRPTMCLVAVNFTFHTHWHAGAPPIVNVHARQTIVAKVAPPHFQALMIPFKCLPHMPPRPVGTHGGVNGAQKVGHVAVGGMWAVGYWPFPTLGHQHALCSNHVGMGAWAKARTGPLLLLNWCFDA